jgi:pantoate--beta-alanine ligase
MSVEQISTIAALRARLAAPRRSGRRIGLVPTMGALHRGHASLIARARRECDDVVVTLFVNPLQFDRRDDLDRYPRTLDADLALCAEQGADVAFVPSSTEMYPSAPRCTVQVTELADHLCGAFRPGHFSGVATVVMKLFQIVQADVAYFGEKDAQQLAIVRRLVADFNVPLTIVGVETVREADGVALSSRNQHLGQQERTLAPVLYQALAAARSAIEDGERDASTGRTGAAARIPADGRLRLEYLEIVDPESMQPVQRISGPVVIAGALWVGNTRLIDNVRASGRVHP